MCTIKILDHLPNIRFLKRRINFTFFVTSCWSPCNGMKTTILVIILFTAKKFDTQTFYEKKLRFASI